MSANAQVTMSKYKHKRGQFLFHNHHHVTVPSTTCCSYADEEHWTKLLQANEINANVACCRCHCKHSTATKNHHVISRGPGAGREEERGGGREQATVTYSPPPTPSDNIFINLYDRISQWFAERRRLLLKSESKNSSRRQSRDSCCSSEGSHRRRVSLRNGRHRDDDDWSHYNTVSSLSSEDSDLSSVFRSPSSTCSSITLASVSSAATYGDHRRHGGISPCPSHIEVSTAEQQIFNEINQLTSDVDKIANEINTKKQKYKLMTRRRLQSDNTAQSSLSSSHSTATILRNTASTKRHHQLCKTWPLRRKNGKM